ncbi:MAG: phosphatidylcholine/phosphatidylserine synthase [Pseudobdellovibrionaceae bacterium]
MDESEHREGRGEGLKVPISRFIPNMITILAMIAGVTSVQKAIVGQYEVAVIMLIAAALFDVLDGAMARLLKAQSEFGAQLDSLSDFLAFGVAPGIILYDWLLAEAGQLGWIAAIVFPVAAALRLARFNVAAKSTVDIPLWKKRYFSGVPTPAGAGLCLLPMYIWFLFPDAFTEFSFAAPLVAVWAIFVGMLMVSRIPTFSLKYLKLPRRMSVAVLAFAALIVAALIHATWITMTLLALAYLASIPAVLERYRAREMRENKTNEDLASLAFGIAPTLGDPEKDDQDFSI